MHLLLLVAILFAPVVAVAVLLAFLLVRVDYCGGVHVMGLRVRRGVHAWYRPAAGTDAAAHALR